MRVLIILLLLAIPILGHAQDNKGERLLNLIYQYNNGYLEIDKENGEQIPVGYENLVDLFGGATDGFSIIVDSVNYQECRLIVQEFQQAYGETEIEKSGFTWVTYIFSEKTLWEWGYLEYKVDWFRNKGHNIDAQLISLRCDNEDLSITEVGADINQPQDDSKDN